LPLWPLYYIVLKSSQAERIFQQLEQKFTGGNRENGVGFDPEAQFGHGFFRGWRGWSRMGFYRRAQREQSHTNDPIFSEFYRR
jgi:hypothetical protein